MYVTFDQYADRWGEIAGVFGRDAILKGSFDTYVDRVLPDLANNIKCGNSLIGPGFFDGKQLALLDDDTAQRVNAFDWQAEFAQVFEDGGFDVIIGNPPYIRIQTMKEWAPVEVEHCKQRYRAASKGNYDIYVVAVRRRSSRLSHVSLTKPGRHRLW